MSPRPVVVEFNGETYLANDLERSFGLSLGTIQRRLTAGWSIDLAVKTPMQPGGGGIRSWERMSVEARFWSKVEKTETCWLWTAGIFGPKRPYGMFSMNGRTTRAHVLSFEWHHGRKARGLIMHTCNVPRCVRPDHLEEGTCKQNLEYAASLGRMAHGSRNGSAKLSEEQVRTIFRLYRDGAASQQVLADEYGVSQPVVSEIVRRTKWQRATEGL